MKLIIYFLGCTFFYIGAVHAQLSKFQKTYGGANFDYGFAHKQLSDNSYIIAGKTRSFGAGDYDGYLVKLDDKGTIEWSKSYGSEYSESFNDVIVTSDNGYMMCGNSFGFTANNTNSFLYLVKTDVNGVEQWAKTYATGYLYDDFYKVIPTSDGGYVCYGRNRYHVIILKIDSLGNLVFSNRIELSTSGVSQGISLKSTSDGGFILTGQARNNLQLYDLFLIKLDASGNHQWAKNYSAGSRGGYYGQDVLVAADGSYIVSGYTDADGAGLFDGFILKTDVSGNLLWVRTYGGANIDEFSSMTFTCDGGLVMAGRTRSFNAEGVEDLFLMKTNGVGVLQWAKRYGGTLYDDAAYVTRASDCGFVVSGSTESYGTGGSDAYLLKLNDKGVDSLRCNAYQITPSQTIPSLIVSNVIPSYTAWSNETVVSSVETLATTEQTDSICRQCIPPVADFDYVQNVMTLHFLNYSEHGTEYTWNFADGSAEDTMMSAVHEYATTGDYLVRLIVSNVCGTDTIIKNVPVVNTSFCLYSTQPGPSRGEDAMIHNIPSAANSNVYTYPYLAIDGWTWGGTPGIQRSLLRFNLSSICEEANLVSADLSLFYPIGSGINVLQNSGTNDYSMYRISEDWSHKSVTWNNQPLYTVLNREQVPVTSSSPAPRDLINKDVTNLVKDMVTFGNYGFLFRMNTETYYRCATYGSSNWPDPSRRPLLRLVYNPLVSNVTFTDTTICPKDSVQLEVIGGVKYKWYPSTGLSCTDCANPKASPATNKEYKVYIYSCENCAEVKTIRVNVYDTVSVLDDKLVMCKGDSVQLNAVGATSYVWTPSQGLSNSFIPNPKASPSQSTVYSVMGLNGVDCYSSDEVSVSVNNVPNVAFLNPDTVKCSDEIIVLDVTAAGGTVVWQDGSINPVYTVHHTGTYTVEVTNSCGTDSDTIKIGPCCEDINVPNLFTPNGDKHNEYFVIGCLGSGAWNLTVYNRWGALVYTNDNYDNKWDGEGVSDGVYYYYLTKQEEKSYNGWVQIIR